MMKHNGDTRENDSQRPFLWLLAWPIADVTDAKIVGEDGEMLVEKLQRGGGGDGC